MGRTLRGDRLRDLRRDPTEWNFADRGGRWSLGDAQGKFALAQRRPVRTYSSSA